MMAAYRKGTTLVMAFALLLAACGPAEEPMPAGEAGAPEMRATTPTAADIAEIGVRNGVLAESGRVTGGQLTKEQFDDLAGLGYANFVSLRPTSEDGAGWEERYELPDDMAFTRIPIAGAGDLTRENVQRLADALAAFGDSESVVYCASGNRVGALLALKAAWLDGEDPAAALEMGLAAGLTRLEPAVRALLELDGA